MRIRRDECTDGEFRGLLQSPPRAIGKLTASAPAAKKIVSGENVYDFPEDDERDMMEVNVKWVKQGTGTPASEWDFKVSVRVRIATSVRKPL